MRLLVDTHVFLWYITNDHRLSPRVAEAISEASNEVYLSDGGIAKTFSKPETFLKSHDA